MAREWDCYTVLKINKKEYGKESQTHENNNWRIRLPGGMEPVFLYKLLAKGCLKYQFHQSRPVTSKKAQTSTIHFPFYFFAGNLHDGGALMLLSYKYHWRQEELVISIACLSLSFGLLIEKHLGVGVLFQASQLLSYIFYGKDKVH